VICDAFGPSKALVDAPEGRPKASGSIATLPACGTNPKAPGPGAWPGAIPVVLPLVITQVEFLLFGATKAIKMVEIESLQQ
jgi:hypothetical protein